MAGFIGNQIGGTPALQLPDDKGRRRGGENPAGGSHVEERVVVRWKREAVWESQIGTFIYFTLIFSLK